MTLTFRSDSLGYLGQVFRTEPSPTHTDLVGIFDVIGYRGDAGVSKPKRVSGALRFVVDEGEDLTRKLVDELLSAMRLSGTFDATESPIVETLRKLRAAFATDGWELSGSGYLSPAGHMALHTGGREGLESQIERLKNNVADPALQLGIAKELLEAVAKYVLEGTENQELARGFEFPKLIGSSLKVLGLNPKDTDTSQPGGKEIRTVRQSALAIALAVNDLRNSDGTGHGKTAVTKVSPETARYIVREAVSLSQWILGELEAQHGI